MEPDAVELRVLGCLVEKQRTTPDTYPLTLNALRLACNQATNRDPVVDYGEAEIREALQRLHRRGWARLTTGAGSRTVKYRHLLDDELDLDPAGIALVAVLLLRGPQTPGELKQRSERLHPFGSLAELEETLASLAERGVVARLERRPGQKEERYRQLLGDDASQGGVGESGPEEIARSTASLADRVEVLEREVEVLRAALEELAGPLGS